MSLDASQGNICSVSVERQSMKLTVLQSHPGTEELMYLCSCLTQKVQIRPDFFVEIKT